MKRMHIVAMLAALAAPLVARSPVRVHLLGCSVSATGLLEAEVSNTSDSGQTCVLRCRYVIREATLLHETEVSIPAGFKGRVGQFDTSSGRPGSYPGELAGCRKFDVQTILDR